MSHNSDAFGATVAEQQRHADLDVLGSAEEAEETGTGVVGAERVASVDSFDHGSLADAADVDGVLEALFDAFDARGLDHDDCCLNKTKTV